VKLASLAGAPALGGLSIASAKSYAIIIASNAMAGNTQLAAGTYTVKVKGSNAIFTDENGKKFTAPVKIENVAKKHETTAVESTKTSTGEKIQRACRPRCETPAGDRRR